MNAIEAMQAEIEYQVQDLHKLELSSPVNNCLFVGSGDSYIAGLAAQYYSGSYAICCSPIDIIKNHLLVKRRNLIIVSISGNTQANIVAAKIAKKYGVGTISALTARSSSRLAKSIVVIQAISYLAIVSCMQLHCMVHSSLMKYSVQKLWPIPPKSFAILHYLVSKILIR